MNTGRPLRSNHFRRGSVVIMVMIFLVLFASLALAFSASTNMNLQQARNYRTAQASQLTAESGLAFLLQQLQGLYIPPDESDGLAAVYDRLAVRMQGTPNLSTGALTFDGETVTIPAINIGNDRSFAGFIRRAGETHLQISVFGTFAGVSRVARMDVEPVPGDSSVFDYGLASKGKMIFWGNATILGANDPSEANILGATFSDMEAIKLGSSTVLAGDVSTSNPDSYVSVSGNASVAGETSIEAINEHIHIGVGEVVFPEMNPDLYRPFATNVLQDTSVATLENVRIPANTNPIFSSQVNIQGVLFIEQPNQVKFAGGVNITGVIVTEDAGDYAWANNTIEFAGTTTTSGVENLPDLPQFHELRKLAGTMLLAPGFGVDLGGNFGTVNGAMAAEQFTFRGNSHGTIQGPIICYGDTEFKVTSDTFLNIDRSKYDRIPPGFILPTWFRPVPDSYLEY